MSGNGRIARCFGRLRAEGRAGFVPFITAGDPDYGRSLDVLCGLPGAGADIIELGVPFSDPMADGPAIQASSRRALLEGQTLARTLDMVSEFRQGDDETPIVLFGYFNPIHAYGVERFTADARAAGVDGLLVVDLPPEENEELLAPARAHGLDMILLVAPTTGDVRVQRIVGRTSGFVYYVAIRGITGTASADITDVSAAVERIRGSTDLPVAVGFGIKTPEHVASASRVSDAVVVGSALITEMARHLDPEGRPKADLVESSLSFVRRLAAAVDRPSVEQARA